MSARLASAVLGVALASTPLAARAAPDVPVGVWTALEPGGLRSASGVGDENWTTWSYSSALHGVLVFGKYHGAGGVSSGEDQNALLAYNIDTNAWSLFAPAEPCGSEDLPGDGHDEGNAIFDPLHEVFFDKGNLTLGCWSEGTFAYDVCSRAGNRILAPLEPAHSESNGGSFDTDQDAWVMFGGSTGPGAGDVTWIFEHASGTWRSSTAAGPPARQAHGQAYDKAHKKTIVFGGSIGEQGFDDTWAYDFETDAWKEIASNVKPPSRDFPSLAYDDVNQVVVYVGATSYQLDLDDGWTPRPDADLPAATIGQASAVARLAYDPDDQMFLYMPGTTLDVWAFRATEYQPGIGTPGGKACNAPTPPAAASGAGGGGGAAAAAGAGAGPSSGASRDGGANDAGGCGCHSTPPTPRSYAVLLVAAVVLLARRRTVRP